MSRRSRQSRQGRRGRSARATVEQIADQLLPPAWRSRPDWLQLRAYAVREATAIVEAAERSTGASR